MNVATVDITQELLPLRRAARQLNQLSDHTIKQVLNEVADEIGRQSAILLRENAKDLTRMNPNDPKYDRLLLNEDRLRQIASDMRAVADLPSPLGLEIEERTVPSGLHLRKVTVPIGVIGVVFESRPNVTFDVFALCFKSGNAVALKGSRDAHDSNIAIVDLIRHVLASHGLADALYLADSSREALGPILAAVDLVDLIIPRGSQGLIDFVRDNAKVPVIETGAGIVHTYLDESADLVKAKQVIENAKTRRVSVCNALDTLLVHRSRLADLPEIFQDLDKKYRLQVYADTEAHDALAAVYNHDFLAEADDVHYGTEFLSMKLSIKTVGHIDEALEHIAQHSSKHSEAILTEDPEQIRRFFLSVDAATVYANASTAFTDGSQFGLGAEIGISTQKLHARGPMGLRELTSYKWLITGQGQTRP